MTLRPGQVVLTQGRCPNLQSLLSVNITCDKAGAHWSRLCPLDNNCSAVCFWHPQYWHYLLVSVAGLIPWETDSETAWHEFIGVCSQRQHQSQDWAEGEAGQ